MRNGKKVDEIFFENIRPSRMTSLIIGIKKLLLIDQTRSKEIIIIFSFDRKDSSRCRSFFFLAHVVDSSHQYSILENKDIDLMV